MALADFDAYGDALRANRAADFQVPTNFARATRLAAAYRSFLPAPATPTTSVALDKTSAESMGPMPAVGSGRLTLLGGRFNPSGVSGVAAILVDLLVHQGLAGSGVSSSTPTTTNLPTAALTRYTSGEGVMAGAVVYAQLGTSALTFTVSYTNTTPTAGRTSTAVTFGGTGFREAGAFFPIPLEGGDTGVTSIESFTGGNIGGGTLGLVLYKPLAMIALNSVEGAHAVDAVSSGGMIGALAEVHPDACLSLIVMSTAAQQLTGSVLLGEV
jgi:hypothetical protein